MNEIPETTNEAKLNSAREGERIFLIVFVPSLIYAIIRYNIFKDTPWSETPLWVSNKAFSLTATIMIGLSFVLPANRPRREIGLWGFYITSIHVAISLLLLLLGYYEKFYQDNGQFTVSGGLALLAGIVSFGALILAFRNSFLKWCRKVNLRVIHKAVFLALFFNLIHLTLIGSKSWVDPAHWPGYLPPITLISAFFSFYFISQRLRKNLN